MKVLIAIDLSEYSDQVVNSVIHRRWPGDTSFKILTVLSPIPCDDSSPDVWKRFTQDVLDRQYAEAEKLLGEIRKKIAEHVDESLVHVDIRKGSPREQIISAAADWMADKIIIGAHGRSANRILGSIPRSVAEHAHCTVELVRLHPIEKSRAEDKLMAANK